jgi:CheY-like chemotaxis protein
LRRALIVDDEALIRKMLRRLLDRRGFEVLEANTAAAALAVLAGDVPFTIVLCDVRMPGMNGMDLYRELMNRDSKVGGFVFITGDRRSLNADGLRDVPVLMKPFTAEDLDAVFARLGLDAVTT